MPLPTSSVFPPPSRTFESWVSRRSVVHSTKGIVSCTQPLAAKCGIAILNAGGNAADAAVAVAAGLNMTEPCSTGIGGDMFCLFYNAVTGKVSALNGSGRSGAKCIPETIRADLGLPHDKIGTIPKASVHAVTVPGAAAGWVDTVERFGSRALTMGQILAPAIELGESGFPVSELTADYWQSAENMIRVASPNFAEILKRDPAAPQGLRAPQAGEIMKNPALARTFRTLAQEGKEGFYTGRVAEELVKVCRDLGGFLEMDDLRHHLETGSESVEPISLKYTGHGLATNGGGVELWEHPPNGQGIVALMALGILQEFEKQGRIPTWTAADFNTAPYLHAVIEALRLGFADGCWFVADPNVERVPSAELISTAYLAERARLFDPTRASDILQHGDPFQSLALQSSDTVYFAVSDAGGNAISFINSNYAGFGTCIIPKGCGFTLQNRGANFSLDGKSGHPNVLAPRKRPYHTIIPGLVTNLGTDGSAEHGSLHSVYGVMGGFMQPQGHVQVLLGQLVGGLSPQQALDAPRVCIEPSVSDDGETLNMTVFVEEGMPKQTIEGLKRLGHLVRVVTGRERAIFGRGQIIRYTVDAVEKTGVWSAGSDPRGDGAAFPA